MLVKSHTGQDERTAWQTACGVTDMMAHIMERYFTNTEDQEVPSLPSADEDLNLVLIVAIVQSF